MIAARLTELGGRVEHIPAGRELYRMVDTPEKVGASVRATFSGTGTRSISPPASSQLCASSRSSGAAPTRAQ